MAYKGKKKKQSKHNSKPSLPDPIPPTDPPCLFAVSFGTHNICLATNKNGSLETVVNENGDRLTPGFIMYEPKNSKQAQLRAVVGQVASQSADRSEPNCFSHLLEPDQLIRHTSKVNKQENSRDFKIVTELGTVQISYDKILVDFISAIRDTVSANCNKKATHCVIAHSSLVSMEIIETLRNACLKASLIPLQILPSNAFPLLAYGIGQNEKEFEKTNNALVIDIGHKYAEVAIFRVTHGMFQQIKTSRYEDLGGKEFTRLLSEHVITTFNSKYRCDLATSKKALLKITREVSNAKHIFSTLPSASVDIESLFNDIDCHLSITRGRFEALISPIVARVIELSVEMLAQVEMEPNCVTDVVCVGGSCRIPMIQSQLQGKFPTATLHASMPPDEVVALGAAKQCQILEQNSIQDFAQSIQTETISCLTQELILKIEKEQLVFKSGAPLPATKLLSLEVTRNELSFSIYENVKEIGTKTILVPEGVKIVSLKAEAIQNAGIKVSFSDATSSQVFNTFLVAFNSLD